MLSNVSLLKKRDYEPRLTERSRVMRLGQGLHFTHGEHLQRFRVFLS